MAQSVTLIFDIGKPNKKLFLFDENLDEVYNEVARFDEIPDDEDFLSEDLTSLTNWIKESTDRILGNPGYDVRAINFSAYGASMVHLDENGNVIAPFYNYLKPFPEILKKKFFEKYNSEDNFSLTTGSPYMGFLNSGMQLYFLAGSSDAPTQVHNGFIQFGVTFCRRVEVDGDQNLFDLPGRVVLDQ